MKENNKKYLFPICSSQSIEKQNILQELQDLSCFTKCITEYHSPSAVPSYPMVFRCVTHWRSYWGAWDHHWLGFVVFSRCVWAMSHCASPHYWGGWLFPLEAQSVAKTEKEEKLMVY